MNSNYGLILASCERLKCKECNGSGTLPETSTKPKGAGVEMFECKFCNGTGWKSGKPKKLVTQRVR